MSDRPERGRPPSEEDRAWLELMQEARKNSFKSLDESAKQLVAVTPILSGLYTAALSFAKIKPAYWQAHTDARFIFVAPLLLALVSLLCAVVSLYPQSYTFNPYDPERARDTYLQRMTTKHRWLTVGMVFLIGNIFALLVAVWTYLGALAEGNVSL